MKKRTGRPKGSGTKHFHYGKQFASAVAYQRWKKKLCTTFDTQTEFASIREFLDDWNSKEGTTVPYYIVMRWLLRYGISTVEVKRRRKFGQMATQVRLHEKAYDLILAYDNISISRYVQTIIHAILGFDVPNSIVILIDNLPVFFYMKNGAINAYTTRNSSLRERKMIEAILTDAETQVDWRKHVHEWCSRAGFTVLGYNPDNPLETYKE